MAVTFVLLFSEIAIPIILQIEEITEMCLYGVRDRVFHGEYNSLDVNLFA